MAPLTHDTLQQVSIINITFFWYSRLTKWSKLSWKVGPTHSFLQQLFCCKLYRFWRSVPAKLWRTKTEENSLLSFIAGSLSKRICFLRYPAPLAAVFKQHAQMIVLFNLKLFYYYLVYTVDV